MLFLCLWQKCDTSKHKILVVSVCPQSLPFFAIKFQLDVPAAAKKLCGFLKSVGTSGHHICLEVTVTMPTALIKIFTYCSKHLPHAI